MKKTLIPMVAAVVLAGCMTNDVGCSAKCRCSNKKTCAAGACAVLPNTLSDCEKAAGWKLLWDGKTFDGWVGEKTGCTEPPKKGWKIEDGILTVLPHSRINEQGKWEKLPPEQSALGGGGDLVTVKDYKDFELKIDFRLTKAANSGIKYFYNQKLFKGTCEEYQILDPAHPDSTKGRDGKCRRVASLYDMIPANAESAVKPLGEWNTAKIVAKGNVVEHWLNGVKFITYERGSEAFRKTVAESKYVKEQKPGEHWGETPVGRIKIQDHGDSTVSFRNIKIREL